MRRLLSVVAARMGTLAVVQSMANDIALPRQTLSRYLDLLELIFVIKRIPAWSSNLTTRAISTPKLIVTDSGLGGRLIGMSEERAKDPTAPVGPLLENFANRLGDRLRAGIVLYSFLATSGPVMRASSGKVAAMMPRATRIPPAVMR
jgi:hypothetical protein